MEVLLTKRGKLASSVDLTNEASQDAYAQMLEDLERDIKRSVRAADASIKLVFPNSNTSVCFFRVLLT